MSLEWYNKGCNSHLVSRMMFERPNTVEIYVLSALYGLKTGVRSVDQICSHLSLCSKAPISKSSVFNAVTRLLKGGYIFSNPSKYSKKTSVYRISETGEEYFVKIMHSFFFPVLGNFRYEDRKEDFARNWYCEPDKLPTEDEDLTQEALNQMARHRYDLILHPVKALSEIREGKKRMASANAVADENE